MTPEELDDLMNDVIDYVNAPVPKECTACILWIICDIYEGRYLRDY